MMILGPVDFFPARLSRKDPLRIDDVKSVYNTSGYRPHGHCIFQRK